MLEKEQSTVTEHCNLQSETLDRITDALVSLHWLRVLELIQYKIAVLTELQSSSRYRTVIPGTTHSCC